MSKQNIGGALQTYESDIWDTADILYAHSFKASEWPNLMMPFFALLLVESRIVRSITEKIKELEIELEVPFDRTNEEHIELLNDSVLAQNYGYHPELVKHGRTLWSLCETQPYNFYSRLIEYLEKYDVETKTLLGVGYAQGTSKYLDLQGVIGALNAKKQGTVDVLYDFTKAWAQIDLSIFNNSEVTTIEEHIKRKWADISAETAGQHYTPFDIIELCTDINVAIAPIDPDGSWEVYDMTCGGGNFLFGLEDSLRNMYPNLSVHAYGQEYNDQLYALAAIESRFRAAAKIEYGNTLTNDRFTGQQFGSVIGNPPYGTTWDKFKDTILKDKTGRFSHDKLPPVSDSQMLFLQHAVSHLKENGVGSIVHNGSPLTSGDAQGGESNIRQYLLKELDVVQAIIQLPQSIFFNTGISTYIWVLNKSKPAKLKGKVMLINAENMFTKLKKSLNKKSNIIDSNERKLIVKTLLDAVDTDICKLVSVDNLMYNKVEIEITRQDENGLAVQELTKKDKNGNDVCIAEKLSNITSIQLTDLNGEVLVLSVNNEFVSTHDEVSLKQRISDAQKIKITTQKNIYLYDTEENTVEKNGCSLGKGVVSIKISKPKKVDNNQVRAEAFLSALKEKDSEITLFDSEAEKNDIIIAEFLAKWVKEPHKILEKKEGCEINFNKIFPKKVEIRKSSDILAELSALDKEFGEI
jgi:type I restriction enzyme M protein